MKTATKILSMLLLVAMCLSLMGGSAYASGLAPLGDGNSNELPALGDTGSTGSSTGTDGIFGLAPVGDSSTGSTTSSSTGSTTTGSGSGETVFGLYDTDSGMELYSSLDHNWIVGANVYKTLDEALALSRELNGGKDLRATLMPHGANTLPKFA